MRHNGRTAEESGARSRRLLRVKRAGAGVISHGLRIGAGFLAGVVGVAAEAYVAERRASALDGIVGIVGLRNSRTYSRRKVSALSKTFIGRGRHGVVIMKSAERRWLIQSIRDLLLPALVERGFTCIGLPNEDAKNQEFRKVFPFGRYRRVRLTSVDQIEIQLDHNGYPAFRLNLGMIDISDGRPASGAELHDYLYVHDFPRRAELCRGGLWASWFTVRHWPWKNITAESYRELVQEVIALFQGVDAYFQGSMAPSQGIRHLPT